jgi:hypothetical protein
MTQPAQQQAPQLQSLIRDPKRPRIFSVSTVHGEHWVLYGIVPGSDKVLAPDSATGGEVPGSEGTQALQITEMFMSEDGSVDVYALPKAGSEWHRQEIGLIINLHPSGRKVMTAARGDLWIAMQIPMADRAVADLVSKWTDIPVDMVADHMEDMRAELEEDGEDPEPGVPAEPPEISPPTANGTPTAGAPS